MDQISVTTYSVGAQQSFAASLTSTFPNVGLIERQPGFAPVRRRTLMAAVNTLSKSLGLRPASVMVLDALLSCLPCQDDKTGADQPITPLTLLTVYASNDTLCFRAKGIPERQLRRHLDRLEAAGLVSRRDSSNGKRFPIHRGGKVVGAYGIDLSPLLAQSASLILAADRRRKEAMELRGLRAIILRLRLDCLGRHLCDESLSFVETVQTVLRRATLTLTQARALLAKLSDILQGSSPDTMSVALPSANLSDALPALPEADDPSAQPKQDLRLPKRCEHLAKAAQGSARHTSSTSQPSATDGQNDRHKKTPESDSKKTNNRTASPVWDCLRCLPAFYPERPDSDHALRQILFDTGAMLRIGENKIAEAIARIGLAETLVIIDQIADRPDEITKPEAYLLGSAAAMSHSRFASGENGRIAYARKRAKTGERVPQSAGNNVASQGYIAVACVVGPG